jgi:hypothetical protein
MFAPDGYHTWVEMCDAAGEWSQDIMIASIPPELNNSLQELPSSSRRRLISERLVSSGHVQSYQEAEFTQDLLALWLLANFMDTYEIILCSPEGLKMRCPGIVKAHGDALDWCQWVFPDGKFEQGGFHGYYENFRAGLFDIRAARDRFVAIDHDTGLLKLKNNTANLMYHSSYGHGSDLREIEEVIKKFVNPYVGWAICFHPDAGPENLMDFFYQLGFDKLDWDMFAHSGKPSSQQMGSRIDVVECVFSAFPNGKGGNSWAVVEDKVGYSRRHIVRALKQCGRYDGWAQHGHSE